MTYSLNNEELFTAMAERKKANTKTGARSLYWAPGTWDTYDYKALPSCIFFGSTFEFRVFKELVFFGIPPSYFKHQVKFLIKPETTRYPALYWCCDLVLDPPPFAAYPRLLIEAKGEVTSVFQHNLQFLELHNPQEYDRLVVVTDREPKRIDKRTKSITIPMLKELIKKMSEEF